MKRAARGPGSRAAGLAVLAGSLLLGGSAQAGVRDRALYEGAKKARAALDASLRRQARRSEWERVVLLYRRVVARYPRSGYCDNALLAVGDLYQQMADRFETDAYRHDAVKAYRMLISEYPSSSLKEKALFQIFDVIRDGDALGATLKAGKAYLKAYPRGPRAREVKNLMQTAHSERKSGASRRKGLATVENLRFWSGPSSTRVVVDLNRQVDVKYDRIGNPDRLWVDLLGTKLSPSLTGRTFPVGDGLLEQIRIGKNRDGVVRVVLDFKDASDHNLFYLQDPARLVVDVHAPQADAEPRPTGTATADAVPPPKSTTAPAAAERAAAKGSEPSLPPKAGPATADAGSTASGPKATEPRSASAAATPPPVPPKANTTGAYSLARQLGLGARTIVIDPGHGGHDPGSIGPHGLKEKDLVLDVSMRLASLLRKRLGADVIMTRSKDVFIPLEERTAIANTKKADLFLSVHANSSRSPSARGIETYFLNFAADRHAEAVAARENAISEATLKDLQNLVKAITLNSKIDESRDFATAVHKAMISDLRPVHNRGVRTAPFYVLIGANMPSILAEISFVSNPKDERLLRSPDYRQQIAESLCDGVRDYLDELNRTQTRQLTERASDSRVDAGKGSRR